MISNDDLLKVLEPSLEDIINTKKKLSVLMAYLGLEIEETESEGLVKMKGYRVKKV